MQVLRCYHTFATSHCSLPYITVVLGQLAARTKQTAGDCRCTVPETNPEMDVFRIGTLLELVREVAVQLAADGKRTKLCVQGSMGEGVFQGLPITLSGAPSALLRRGTAWLRVLPDA